MLPMFNAKKIASRAIMARRGKSDTEVSPEVEAPGSELDPALKDAAADLLSAIEHKSVIDIAKAMKAGHAACEDYEGDDDDQGEEPDESEGE